MEVVYMCLINIYNANQPQLNIHNSYDIIA